MEEYKLELSGHFKPNVKPFPVHLSHADMKPMKYARYILANEARNEHLISLQKKEIPFSLGLYARDYSLDK